MAGLAAILGAVARMVWRDLRALGSLGANNFFLFVFLLLGRSGAFLQVVLGLLLLFPLSADPLRKIPPSRLTLWPLDRAGHILLRAASVWLSPAVWITVAILIWAARPVSGVWFFLAALACFALSVLFTMLPARFPRFNLLRFVPALPGPAGGLIGKDIREMLTVLDTYAALILSGCGLAYRLVSRQPELNTLFGLTLLVMLALSTYAQCLFGLETDSGLSRYRLLPLRGWQILAAKDAAFLGMAVLLALPLAPLPGLGAGFMALAVGHHSSVRYPVAQHRWRFTGGTTLFHGLAQVVLMFTAAATVHRVSVFALAVCAAAWALSLWFYGREFERGH